jgi:hypothetical protein
MTDESIFAAALDISDPARRRAYLGEACAGDAARRARVEGLLAAHRAAGSFLDAPARADPDHATTRAHDASADDDIAAAALSRLAPSARPGALGRVGHYDVLEVLGSGGFGVVFRAFDDVLQRVVAVKMMAPAMAATSPARKRFLREARASAQVRHENVVQVYAVEEQPLPYIVMEFIPGRTLQQKIEDAGPLAPAEVVRIGREVAEGLAAAHAQGLIHRDVKPANVLIEGGPRERAKLTDFGLARAADDASLTQSGAVVGTPLFMSPEQAAGGPLDHRTDLFSLGSVLYTLLTGRPPFRAPTSLAVLKRVAEDQPRPIRDLVPDAPPALCAIIERLHAKRPADRFQSAAEVAERLSECLAVPPNPAGWLEPFAFNGDNGAAGEVTPRRALDPGEKPAGRRVPVFVAAAAALLAAGVVLAFYTLRGNTPVPATGATAEPQQPPPQRPSPKPSPPQPSPSQHAPSQVPSGGGQFGSGQFGVGGQAIFGGGNGGPWGAGPSLPQPLAPPPKLTGVAALLASAEWGTPTPVPGRVNTAEPERNPALTSDELAIVFARGAPGAEKLFQCQRARVADPFGPAVPLPDAIQDKCRTPASLSGDGRLLVFGSRTPEAAWESTRGDAAGPFGVPQRLPPLAALAGALSADGLTLVVSGAGQAGRGGVVVYTRASRREPFGGEGAHLPLTNSFYREMPAWVSDDRLALVVTRTINGITEARLYARPTADSPFGEPRPLVIPGTPGRADVGWPWVSPDGMRLYFHSRDLPGGSGHYDIWVAERKRK